MNLSESIKEKIQKGRRISEEDALELFETDLLQLAKWADYTRKKLHPENTVTFVVDRNINYTNICESGCRFCAFYRRNGHPEGYVISQNDLKAKIDETKALGGSQILLQGGMHPDLGLDYYLELLNFIKEECPVHIHGFSPPEIVYLADKTALSVKAVLVQLIEAGLDSIPGGGAEILVDEIREKVSPGKCNSERWLDVMETAHRMGLRTTSTMMFGHLEKTEHIFNHMSKLRDLQDRTNGFTAFIPWTFQPGNTKIDVLPATSAEYLRILAISRLFLDNIPNIQASWVTQGSKIAQAALAFGSNDLGSIMIEENVVAAAGVRFRLPREEMVRLAHDAGFKAAQRDCFYNIVKKYDA